MFRQAASRGIRPHNQAMIRVGGEQGRGASHDAYYRVPRLAVSSGKVAPDVPKNIAPDQFPRRTT